MRVVGRVLVGVGVFLIVLAPFMRFYAYPKLAKAPEDQTLKIVSEGANANILDPKTFTNYRTNLTSVRLVQGDVDAADKQGGDTDVWNSTVSTLDATGKVLQRTIERAAFDANTSADVNCCGEFVSLTKGVQTPVKHTGIVFKFPFLTQKHDYLFWDITLQKATPMIYEGTEDIDGYTTYKYVQTIKPTPYGEVQQLNRNALDLPGEGDVAAQTYYSNVRTVWVEPETGVILKGTEKQYNTIRAEGQDRIVTTAVTIGYNDASVKDLADEFGGKGVNLHRIRVTLPLISLIAGIVVLGAGIVLAFGLVPLGNRRSAQTSAPASA